MGEPCDGVAFAFEELALGVLVAVGGTGGGEGGEGLQLLGDVMGDLGFAELGELGCLLPLLRGAVLARVIDIGGVEVLEEPLHEVGVGPCVHGEGVSVAVSDQ